jgi:hypothetical protein
MVDAVRQMLGSIEVSDAEGERRHAADCYADPPAAVARSAGESAVVAAPAPSFDAAELSSSNGDILMQSDRVTEILDIPAILSGLVAAAGGALVTKRCATSGATSKRMQTAIFPMILTSCGGLPPRMTTSTKLGPTTSSILLAKRLAFPSALNSPVNPNNPEQSKAT